jgi:Protein of unknown function (DUF2844)
MLIPDVPIRLILLRCTALVAILFLWTLPSFAALGEDVSSVQSDQVHMKAAGRVIPGQFYSIHEMQAPTGTAIREFVSPAGTVFAVAWQGPSTPDLRQLLGTHFDEFIQAAQSSSSRRGRGRHIETGDLVFDSGGHMRFLVGRAFLRSKVPSGADPNAIH